MNQYEVARAKAKRLTDDQRTKTHASLEVFASALGVAAGKWVTDVVAELLTKKRPELLERHSDADLSEIKAKLTEVTESWPNQMHAALLEAGIMEDASESLAAGVRGRAYAAANGLITAEAAPVIRKAFNFNPELKMRHDREHDFPTSVQHLVQVPWEDFAADRSLLKDYEKLQRTSEQQLQQQIGGDRWEKS